MTSTGGSGNELQALLALQEIDTHLDQQRHKRSHLPEMAELASLKKDREAALAAQSEAGARRDELAARQGHMEAELKGVEDRIKAVSDRLFSGAVSASRDLQAMAGDVESLRSRASILEENILALMEQADPLDTAVTEANQLLEDIDERAAKLHELVTVAQSEIDTAIAELETERETAAEQVPEPLRRTYESMRPKLGGIAVARLVGGRCDGCHLSLSSVELDHVRHQSPDTISTCEQCGRILVVVS